MPLYPVKRFMLLRNINFIVEQFRFFKSNQNFTNLRDLVHEYTSRQPVESKPCITPALAR